MFDNSRTINIKKSHDRSTNFLRVQVLLHQSVNNARELLIHQVGAEDVKMEIRGQEGPQG